MNKKENAVRISQQTKKKINELAKKEKRTNKTIMELAVDKYYELYGG